MGVLGAALATLLGRVFAAAWVFWQQQQIENPLCIRHIADMKPDGDLIRRILGIGIPSGFSYSFPTRSRNISSTSFTMRFPSKNALRFSAPALA